MFHFSAVQYIAVQYSVEQLIQCSAVQNIVIQCRVDYFGIGAIFRARQEIQCLLYVGYLQVVSIQPKRQLLLMYYSALCRNSYSNSQCSLGKNRKYSTFYSIPEETNLTLKLFLDALIGSYVFCSFAFVVISISQIQG